VAAQSRVKAARRRRNEARCAEMVGAKMVEDDLRLPWLELYEEIARLPERLRGPLVLCYLKG
jgi:hypothetical protein